MLSNQFFRASNMGKTLFTTIETIESDDIVCHNNTIYKVIHKEYLRKEYTENEIFKLYNILLKNLINNSIVVIKEAKNKDEITKVEEETIVYTIEKKENDTVLCSRKIEKKKYLFDHIVFSENHIPKIGKKIKTLRLGNLEEMELTGDKYIQKKHEFLQRKQDQELIQTLQKKVETLTKEKETIHSVSLLDELKKPFAMKFNPDKCSTGLLLSENNTVCKRDCRIGVEKYCNIEVEGFYPCFKFTIEFIKFPATYSARIGFKQYYVNRGKDKTYNMYPVTTYYFDGMHGYADLKPMPKNTKFVTCIYDHEKNQISYYLDGVFWGNYQQEIKEKGLLHEEFVLYPFVSCLYSDCKFKIL